MGSLSQSWPMTVASVAAMEADAPLAAMLAAPGIYNGQAPAGSLFPYITLGLAQESDDPATGVFNRGGTLAGQIFDIWTRKQTLSGGSVLELGDRELKLIYGRLRFIFHHQPLAVEGFGYVLGKIALIATAEDPGGEAMHATVRYDLISREAA